MKKIASEIVSKIRSIEAENGFEYDGGLDDEGLTKVIAAKLEEFDRARKERLDKARGLLVQLEKWAESPDPVESPPNPPGLSDWPPIPPRQVVLNQVRVIKHLLAEE